MPISVEDRILIDRIAQGDADAEERFVTRFQPRLLYCARMAGIPDQDCEDLAQEVLFAAISQIRLSRFRGDSALGTWVESIFRHIKVDRWRRNTAERRVIVSGDARDTSEGSEMSVADNAKHNKVYLDQEAVISVQEALSRMAPEYRVILLLNRSLGYTIEEISARLNLTMGQVSRRLYTSEKMFRRAIDGETVRPRSSPKVRVEDGEDA